MVPKKAASVSGNSSSVVSSVADNQERRLPQKGKKTIYTVLAIIVSIIVVFWLASSVLPQVLVYLTRAANQSSEFSLANSYIFGSPLVAEGDGQEKIRISAFLLDAKGRGVPDQQIDLTVSPKSGSSGQPQVNVIQEITDEFGRAIFEVTSTFKGQFVVAASVGGLDFPQTVTLTYR